jgi:hypothetical protein
MNVFCTWNNGPVVETWGVVLDKSSVVVYCREAATEAQVREHCERLYCRAYGRVVTVRKVQTPAYCKGA